MAKDIDSAHEQKIARALLIQDAYHYALAACERGSHSFESYGETFTHESTFKGRGNPRGRKALQMAILKAADAELFGVGDRQAFDGRRDVARPARLLVRFIYRKARKLGIDAYAGTPEPGFVPTHECAKRCGTLTARAEVTCCGVPVVPLTRVATVSLTESEVLDLMHACEVAKDSLVREGRQAKTAAQALSCADVALNCEALYRKLREVAEQRGWVISNDSPEF